MHDLLGIPAALGLQIDQGPQGSMVIDVSMCMTCYQRMKASSIKP